MTVNGNKGKILLLCVLIFVTGLMSLWWVTHDNPPAISTSHLPDGKWEIYDMVKGFDVNTGKPVYWAIGHRIHDEVVSGEKVEVHSAVTELLTFPREQVGDSPNDRSVDPRFQTRTIKLEVKEGNGHVTVVYPKNSL